jgi:hypothetical protein
MKGKQWILRPALTWAHVAWKMWGADELGWLWSFVLGYVGASGHEVEWDALKGFLSCMLRLPHERGGLEQEPWALSWVGDGGNGGCSRTHRGTIRPLMSLTWEPTGLLLEGIRGEQTGHQDDIGGFWPEQLISTITKYGPGKKLGGWVQGRVPWGEDLTG